MSDAASPAASTEYELRGADGRQRGLYDITALRAMLYVGEIDTACKVRAAPAEAAWPAVQGAPGTAWLSLVELPELVEVMELLGMETGADQAEHRIAGWQRSAHEPEEDSGTTNPEISQVLRAAAPPPQGAKLPVAWLVVGALLLVLVFVVIGLVLS